MVIGKHRELQRITVPYARVVDVLNGKEDTMIVDE